MEDIPCPIPDKPVKFMDQLRCFIRSKHLAYRTEKTYCRWVAAYIRFHGMKHPTELNDADVQSYLSYLAVQRHVAINTQKTALNALAFLYGKFCSALLVITSSFANLAGLDAYLWYSVQKKPRRYYATCRESLGC